MIVALLLLTVVAVILGGGIGYLMTGAIEKNVHRKEEATTAQNHKPLPQHYTDDIMLRKLEPITTNLMSPDTVFIKVEASLVIDKTTGANNDKVALLSAEISQDILSFLRTVTVAQLQGPSGLQNLREDLNDRVAIRSRGKVRELILETMVIQ